MPKYRIKGSIDKEPDALVGEEPAFSVSVDKALTIAELRGFGFKVDEIVENQQMLEAIKRAQRFSKLGLEEDRAARFFQEMRRQGYVIRQRPPEPPPEPTEPPVEP